MPREKPEPRQDKPTIEHPQDEYSAFNALIQDRGAQWSKHARAIKFDVEFKALEQERRRVAKELHDEILPLLARLIRSIQTNPKATQRNEVKQFEPPVVANGNEALIEELHSAVDAFRDMLGELHAVDLEELGLAAALNNLCKRYTRFTGRSIIFVEQSEECFLTEHQQLCLYRAVQTALKMFSECDNDILLIRYDYQDFGSIITLRCVDKRVYSADWLVENQGYDTLESWCRMAAAEIEIDAIEYLGDQFPCDLIISASEAPSSQSDAETLIGEGSQVMLQELDSIMALAQEEWISAINRDCALFKKLAVELERKKISDEINRLIMPHLDEISKLARSAKSHIKKEVKQRMQVIASGVNNVISELHPQLLHEIGFVSSIRTLVDRFRHATLVETTMISNLWSDQLDAIPLDTKFALYRVIQEALNNIEKHSDATRALVIVAKNKGELSVCIEDNGKGIQRSGVQTLSRGLKIIKERAASIGAQIVIETSSSFETGTIVTISVPFSTSTSAPNVNFNTSPAQV